jgi:hypothetical protein
MYVVPLEVLDDVEYLTLLLDTAWSRRPATSEHQESLWRQLRNPMAQAGVDIYISWEVANDLEAENRPKFLNLKKVFWIKWSDFMDIVPRHPHLAGITWHPRDFVLKPYVFATPIPLRPGTDGASSSGIKDEEHNPSLTNGDGSMVNGHK